MSLDVYFKEDIANVIRSVNMAGGNAAAIARAEIQKAERKNKECDLEELTDKINLYQQGHRDALGAVAAAFGILPQ